MAEKVYKNRVKEKYEKAMREKENLTLLGNQQRYKLKNSMSGVYIFYEADLFGTSVFNESPVGDEFSTDTFRIERKCSAK